MRYFLFETAAILDLEGTKFEVVVVAAEAIVVVILADSSYSLSSLQSEIHV